MTQLFAILAVAALAVAFGLLSRRRDDAGASSDACSKSEPEGGCGACSIECDRTETTHVRS